MGHTAPSGGFCLTASGLVFSSVDAPKVLVHQHKRYHRLLIPGGHVEPEEHPWAAVLRELREEAGIAASQLKVLQPLSLPVGLGELPAPAALDVHPVEGGWTHTDLVFAFVIDGQPQFAPAEGESLDLFWLSVAELRQHDLPQRSAALAARLEPALAGWLLIDADSFGS